MSTKRPPNPASASALRTPPAYRGQTVGYVVVCHGYSIEYGGVTGFLDELYLLPAARGRGIGSATLRFLRKESGRRGWVSLLLEVVRGNRKAARLYARRGFADHGRTLMTARAAR